jgi:hypothetical protein
VDVCLHLHFANFRVFLYFVRDLNSLPRQFAFEQVQHQVSQRLKVIASALLIAQMGGDTGISGSADEGLAALDFDMFSGFVVFVPFGESKINDVDSFNFVSFADHKIIGFDVSVYESFAMNLLQAGDDLDSDVDGGGKGEFLIAEWQKSYQSWKRSSSE